MGRPSTTGSRTSAFVASLFCLACVSTVSTACASWLMTVCALPTALGLRIVWGREVAMRR